MVFLPEGQDVGSPTREKRRDRIDGISRTGDEHSVPRVDKSKGDVGNPLFGPNQGEDLCSRVEVDSKSPFNPFRRRSPKFKRPLIGGIPVILRIFGGSLQPLDDGSGWGCQGLRYQDQSGPSPSFSALSSFGQSLRTGKEEAGQFVLLSRCAFVSTFLFK